MIGIPLMFVASRLPIAFWKRIAWPALIFATAFQLLVFTPLGVDGRRKPQLDHDRGIQAQPAEFLKLALALWLGYVLFRKQTLLGLVAPRLHPARAGLDPRDRHGPGRATTSARR